MRLRCPFRFDTIEFTLKMLRKVHLIHKSRVKLLPESLCNIGVKMYELKCSTLCKMRAIPTLFITKMSVKEAPKGGPRGCQCILST